MLAGRAFGPYREVAPKSSGCSMRKRRPCFKHKVMHCKQSSIIELLRSTFVRLQDSNQGKPNG